MTVSPHASPATLVRRLCFVGGLLILTAPALAQTTQPSRPTVLAHGSADRYWVAGVESYREGTKPKFKTLVRGQALPAGDWKDLGVVLGQAVGLAESQGELAILLDDGSWKRLGGAGLATGPTLPGTGPVLAWGSARGALYAVRAVEGGREGVTTRPAEVVAEPSWLPATRPVAAATQATTTTTRPATAAAAATTKPTTRPSALALLKYERGQWVGVADLPAGAAGGTLAISGVGTKPLLAVATDAGPIRTYLLTDSQWQEWGEVRPGAQVKAFGALSAGNLPALWTLDPDGGMKLFLKREGEEWTGRTLELPGAPAAAQRTLAAAGDEFRLVLSKDGKFWEQRYDPTGAPRGTLTEMPTPQVYKPDPYIWMLQWLAALGMVVVMLVTFYKRRAMAKDDGEDKP